MSTACLGVDIGSITVSLLLLSAEGDVLEAASVPHEGDPWGRVEELLAKLAYRGPLLVAETGASRSWSDDDAPDDEAATRWVDPHVALVAAVGHRVPEARSIVYVGGERFGYIRLDREGRFAGLLTNTSCAAGTGSFLDQQARRLGLSSSGELAALALSSNGELPTIASRCAVFAKTDIIHAQQEGYAIPEICDGLCFGLARNIVDTLFAVRSPESPLVLAGGVAANRAVTKHLESLIGVTPVVDPLAPLFGALGAACVLRDALVGSVDGTDGSRIPSGARTTIDGLRAFLHGRARSRSSGSSAADRESRSFAPLELPGPAYPDFDDHEHYRFESDLLDPANPVDVDVYAVRFPTSGDGPREPGSRIDAYLGIDVGSTSTKTMVIDAEREPVLGCYTRTAGKPLQAVQGIFQAIRSFERERRLSLHIVGAATTGSGRSFIGALIGADLELDEISAHARAAVELDPAIDTIIEIGGQDSKFTSLQEGMVTFSQMNTVCAAGTGSFLEEQAAKLGVRLEEYNRRAFGISAPLTSDRCTVFMERDLNYQLVRGASIDELLASSVHAVRENYLLKVASSGTIGERVCFQGATAKNRALVSAFEAALGKPLAVSRYCHLTGAWGAALTLAEERSDGESSFRGVSIADESIAVRSEICPLCSNHCRLRVAEVAGNEVAFGFLCGRDYATKHFVPRSRRRFDLVKEHRRHFAPPRPEAGISSGEVVTAGPAGAVANADAPTSRATLGIPATLHLFDDLPFWTDLFDRIGIDFVTSDGVRDVLATGKRKAGAEFCSPIAAFHGHVLSLARRAEWIFCPLTIEAGHDNDGDAIPDRLRPGGVSLDHAPLRKLCYYTQFAPSLAAQLLEREHFDPARLLRPVIDPRRGFEAVAGSVYESLAPLLRLGRREFIGAYRESFDRVAALKRAWSARFSPPETASVEPEIMLLGRPYVVYDEGLNKRIPDAVAARGVRVWFQDMIDIDGADAAAPSSAVHWHYASTILDTALFCASTPGLYPILVTCFKCNPDAFVIEYLKRIMSRAGKPYLILQLDEHDSSVGYETRIEAALRSFRNHRAREIERGAAAVVNDSSRVEVVPGFSSRIDGKVLLFPNYDRVTTPLLIANLARFGIDARLLEEDDRVIRESMRHNTGQCLPLDAIAEEVVRFVRKYRLPPERTAVWMIRSQWACSIGMYPNYLKSLVAKLAPELETVDVYAGELTFRDLSLQAAVRAYSAYLLGGTIRRLACRLRPYETEPGATEHAVGRAIDLLIPAFRGSGSLRAAAREAFDGFERIETVPLPHDRPKVAIFGDLYTRDNDVFNQNLVKTIEDAGGEIVTTSYHEYVRTVGAAVLRRCSKNADLGQLVTFRSLLALANLVEATIARYIPGVIDRVQPLAARKVEEVLDRFQLDIHQEGESYENVLNILQILRRHPDLSLLVQASPAFCCPALVTEAMKSSIEEVTGVPMVSITYDGTGAPRNSVVIPYVEAVKRRQRRNDDVDKLSGLRYRR